MSLQRDKQKAWEEFLACRERVSSGPFRASIEVTRNCGLRCSMCAQAWRPEYRRRDPAFDMTPAVFEAVARELFPLLERVNLQGYGETTVSAHWPRILDLCEPFAGRMRFEIVTNLIRQDERMWRRLLRMGFEIFASCDGATEETFQDIRAGARLSSLIGNLEALSRAREDGGGRRPALLVTLQRRNADEMPLFVDLAARTGAGRVIFSTVAAANGWRGAVEAAAAWARLRPPRVRTIHSLPREELADLVGRTLARSRELGIPVQFTDAALDERAARPAAPLARLGREAGIAQSIKVCAHQRCFKPYSTVVVNYRGDVGLCNHLLSDEHWEQMGNLLRDPLEKIWNSDRYRLARGRLARGEPLGAACRWCHSFRIGE
ncbi:MAG: SPASM domain-containing protein [Elusimicrobia bacterium]|nr:SPASM domain-containing protein [Elusimicrobiota bacterium]